MDHQTHSNPQGSSEPQPDHRAILAQLERLFHHPAFKNSRRSQALLRYVVENRGESGDGHLKERTLGIVVFGREATYDTNADPVVRIAAGEVRKRIAQYYHEPGHETEIRIDLPLGSYIPEFHVSPSSLPPAAEPGPALAVHSSPPALPLPSTVPAPGGTRPWVVAVAALSLTVLVGALGWRTVIQGPAAPEVQAATPSAMDKFWRPILKSSTPIQIGVGPWPSGGLIDPHQVQGSKFRNGGMRPVGWWDFTVATHVISFLQQSGSSIRIENESATDLSVLSQGPAVLIGANNNPWVMKLTQGLRFAIVQSDGHYAIADRQSPGKLYRSTPGPIPGSEIQYAIVARVSDPTTGQYLVILAGIGSPATVFAGQMATVPQNLDALAAQLPPSWEAKNIEAVVSGQAVDGEPGAPHVVAVDSW